MSEISQQGAVCSVSEALALAKGALSCVRITVRGEVSELSDKPGYKAVYFTISDGSAALPCLMWKNVYETSGVKLGLGMLVEVSGQFGVYVAKGRMNFDARRLALAGQGDLRERVAALARKLEAEGLMSASRKRALKSLPERIAVVTSPRGKAVHDCIRTLSRRWPLAEVLVCGVAVEGAGAVAEIIRGLDAAESARPDAILLVRGGGSYEDLMPFNDEGLARRLAVCSVPVVTGIGHEPDTTICDMVSDKRCSTPTAAAEAVAPDASEELLRLDDASERMASALSNAVQSLKSRLDSLASRPVMARPGSLFEGRELRLDGLRRRLSRALPDKVGLERSRLDFSCRRLLGAGQALTRRFNEAVSIRASRLSDLSPLAVLARGYSIAYAGDGHTVLSSAKDARVGSDIKVRMKDGQILARVVSSEVFEDKEEPDA